MSSEAENNLMSKHISLLMLFASNGYKTLLAALRAFQRSLRSHTALQRDTLQLLMYFMHASDATRSVITR